MLAPTSLEYTDRVRYRLWSLSSRLGSPRRVRQSIRPQKAGKTSIRQSSQIPLANRDLHHRIDLTSRNAFLGGSQMLHRPRHSSPSPSHSASVMMFHGYSYAPHVLPNRNIYPHISQSAPKARCPHSRCLGVASEPF